MTILSRQHIYTTLAITQRYRGISRVWTSLVRAGYNPRNAIKCLDRTVPRTPALRLPLLLLTPLLLMLAAYSRRRNAGANCRPRRHSCHRCDSADFHHDDHTFADAPSRPPRPQLQSRAADSYAHAQRHLNPHSDGHRHRTGHVSVIVRNPVNLRGGPGERFDAIGQVISGQRYPVLAHGHASGDWWQIEVDGLAGWVFDDLVSIEGNSSGLAVVAAPVKPTTLPPVPV